MNEQSLREVLAQEYEREALHDSALVRDGIVSQMDRCALAAMRRMYLLGRDDANMDAEAAAKE